MLVTRVTDGGVLVSRSRPTSRDVARLAGVSRTTVSLVLNNVPDVKISPETRQRVLDAARQLNYYPDISARRLVSGKTHTVALVWHRGPDSTYRDAFLPGLLQGITRAARHYGYHLLFRPIDPDDPDDVYVELARGHHTDGLVLSGPRADDPHLLDLYQDGFPLVLHGQLPGTDIPSVDVDNVRGAIQAVRHLLALGHRRIGMITNAPLAYISSRQRLDGYRQALEEAGLPYDPELVRFGDFDEESGREAMLSLLDLPTPPTGIFVASDMVAIGALRAILDQGLRVPEDIAIVGFDDIAAARFVSPPLTTIRVPAFALGWTAGELLIRIIEHDRPEQTQVLLETDLIVRRSCGAKEGGEKQGRTKKGSEQVRRRGD
ncbi:MAG TPA: LacI family transcriptional regulator [Anaerolineales bacterium]|nr:LacI family transcriptional regulator [Anaerolineae bacterium]HIP86885.1 LacI family transcriptional regulator [Anaerolineales bacterium]